jgi:hypothetical protein
VNEHPHSVMPWVIFAFAALGFVWSVEAVAHLIRQVIGL